MPDGIRHDDAEKWQCDYCDVKDDCDKIYQAQAVVNAMKKDGLAKFID
jgi:hypothetical protein